MGTFRGFISSCGAATSLVIAGVLMLLAASSVVAFNGWPGVRDWPEAEPVAVSQMTTTESEQRQRPVRLGSGRVSPAPSASHSTGAARPARATPSRAAAKQPAAGKARRRRVARTGTPSRPGNSSTRAVPAGGSGPAAGAAPAANPSTVDEVTDTVNGVTAPTRRQPLRLQVPHVRELPALDPVVDTVNGLLNGTTETLRQLLAGQRSP